MTKQLLFIYWSIAIRCRTSLWFPEEVSCGMGANLPLVAVRPSQILNRWCKGKSDSFCKYPTKSQVLSQWDVHVGNLRTVLQFDWRWGKTWSDSACFQFFSSRFDVVWMISSYSTSAELRSYIAPVFLCLYTTHFSLASLFIFLTCQMLQLVSFSRVWYKITWYNYCSRGTENYLSSSCFWLSCYQMFWRPI